MGSSADHFSNRPLSKWLKVVNYLRKKEPSKMCGKPSEVAKWFSSKPSTVNNHPVFGRVSAYFYFRLPKLLQNSPFYRWKSKPSISIIFSIKPILIGLSNKLLIHLSNTTDWVIPTDCHITELENPTRIYPVMNKDCSMSPNNFIANR